MKKSFLLFSLLPFLFISCDLLSGKDDDILKNIDDEIAWANAPKLNVTVAFPLEWGASPHAGTNRCFDIVRTSSNPRRGYAFEVEFTPDPAYSFQEWRAYANSTLSSLDTDWLLDPDILDRENVPRLDGVVVPELPARGGKGDFVAHTTELLTLVPWCKTEHYVI